MNLFMSRSFVRSWLENANTRSSEESRTKVFDFRRRRFWSVFCSGCGGEFETGIGSPKTESKASIPFALSRNWFMYVLLPLSLSIPTIFGSAFCVHCSSFSRAILEKLNGEYKLIDARDNISSLVDDSRVNLLARWRTDSFVQSSLMRNWKTEDVVGNEIMWFVAGW